MVADGMSVDEIITALPDLEPEDVQEALHYAAESVRERELELDKEVGLASILHEGSRDLF